MKRILIWSCVGALGACASMSKQDCEKLDWGQQGFETARKGAKSDPRFYELRKSCVEFEGVAIRKDLFEAGYAQGLKEFCTSANGLEWGASGKKYEGICPASLEDAFLKNYQAGLAHYSATELERLRTEVIDLRRELDERDRRIQMLERARATKTP